MWGVIFFAPPLGVSRASGQRVFATIALSKPSTNRKSSTTTIAEVERIVPRGGLDPDYIHTPGIYVRTLFQGAHYERRIENLTVRMK